MFGPKTGMMLWQEDWVYSFRSKEGCALEFGYKLSVEILTVEFVEAGAWGNWEQTPEDV